MRPLSILLIAIFILPVVLCAETLILRDGTKINTNYFWTEGTKVGYFEDGIEKYISHGLVDWDAMKSVKKEISKTYRRNTPQQNEQTTKRNSGNADRHHTQYRGVNDDIINLSKPDDGAALLLISGNRSNNHFAVTGYTAHGQRTKLLVNTTKSYDGTVLIDVESGVSTTQLEIKAKGEWNIFVHPLKHIRRYQRPGRIEGTGDDVLLVLGSDGIMNIDGNSSGNHFAAIAYSADGKSLLVNTTDIYSGRVMVPKKTFIIEIKAVGSWELGT